MPGIESVPKSPENVCPKLNGMKIPELTLTNSDGADFDLTAAIRTKPASLVFYRDGLVTPLQAAVDSVVGASSWPCCSVILQKLYNYIGSAVNALVWRQERWNST